MTAKHEDSAQAQCYWGLANSYILAAEELINNGKSQTFIPTLFLLAHGLELHFKAFLVSQGVSEKRQRQIGHDLVYCLRECRDNNLVNFLPLTRADIRQIIQVNRYHQEKQLEYFEPVAKCFGSID